MLTPRVMQPSTMRPIAPIAPVAPVPVPVPASVWAPVVAADASADAAALSPREPVALALFPEFSHVVGRADPAASSAGAV